MPCHVSVLRFTGNVLHARAPKTTQEGDYRLKGYGVTTVDVASDILPVPRDTPVTTFANPQGAPSLGCFPLPHPFHTVNMNKVLLNDLGRVTIKGRHGQCVLTQQQPQSGLKLTSRRHVKPRAQSR